MKFSKNKIGQKKCTLILEWAYVSSNVWSKHYDH